MKEDAAVITVDINQLYTIKETAQILKTSPATVRKLCRANALPHLKLGDIKIRGKAIVEFEENAEGMDYTDPFNVKAYHL